MRLISLVLLLGSIWAVNAIHQHDLNPALIEVKRAAARARAHAGNQVSTFVSDPVRAMDATKAGLGILYMKKGTELRTVMGIDPKDQEAIRDMPTFFKTPSGNDPSGAYCKKGRFKTTWKTVKDLRLIVHPGTYAKLKTMDGAFLEEVNTPEKKKFMWRGGVGKGDLAKATPCELGHDVCADIDPQKEYDVKTLSELMSKEAIRIFNKAKASCNSFFGLIKTPALAKDKYKYLCNTNYDPANIGDQHDVAYASALMFGTYYDGYINEYEVVLFGFPNTIMSDFYKPKSWLPLVELVKSEPC